MIHITDREMCCGCEACGQICPEKCITFEQDSEGFYYPVIDKSQCIDCGLCESVCPVINRCETREPIKILAAKNLDEEIRVMSSSGGIFTLLAERILSEGGVVFGARFDKDWNVEHSHCETSEGLAQFRGSKYVQSRIGNSFTQVKAFLDSGRKVMFSGTPCQVAGLRLFLGKEYSNLLLVDIICHGVPSPRVWQKYLNEICTKNRVTKIDYITFRDKTFGWTRCATKISGTSKKKAFLLHETTLNNLYIRGFLLNLFLRPSCHNCPSKSFRSGSDITLADFWGVEHELPSFADNRGISLVIINSPQGTEYTNGLNIISHEVTMSAISPNNQAIHRSVSRHPDREIFFSRMNSNKSILPTLSKLKYTKEITFMEKVIFNLKHIKNRFK